MTLRDLPLPEYEVDTTQTLPLYSAQADDSECVLQFEPERRTGCPACEWVFETKRFKINLGRKMWKLNSPTYGLHGRIDGSIELLDPTCRVESIQATVEGRLRLSCPEKRAQVESNTFLTHTIDIPYNYELPENAFSIPMPSSCKPGGKDIPCPPSYYYNDNAGYIVEVAYYIRFDLTWRVKKRLKTDSRLIGFYYLPKTSPISPPICSLPPASRHCENPPLFLLSPERMRSLPILPVFKTATHKRSSSLTKVQLKRLAHFHHSAYLSLPNPASLTSGQVMPFMLSLCFPDEPCIAELLCENVAVHLYKRIGIAARPGVGLGAEAPGFSERNVLVSSATLRKNSGWAEGVIVLKGEIPMGDAGAETSWALPELARVKYILRVTLKPPPSLAAHIPSFIHEEEIWIHTSGWGAIDRERLSSGGSTTPAVGLSGSLRRIY